MPSANKNQQKFRNEARRLRVWLVLTMLGFAFLSLAGAFLLAWSSRPGTSAFLITAVTLSVWATVTATSKQITPADFAGLANHLRGKSRL